MEKLSVVVPVYNAYPYLRQCLESIINETYKNLEIIIVNDASPYIEDDEICKEYASKDERIIYIKHDINKFQGGARNTGIKAATGKYITFIDSDDYLGDLDTYTECIKYFEIDVDILFFKYSRLEVSKQINYDLCYKENYSKKYQLGVDINIDINNTDVIAWNKIFDKEKLKNNLYFLENTKFEDIEFWYRMVVCEKPIVYGVDKVYYIYRNNSESVTNNMVKSMEDFIVILNTMLSLYNKYKTDKARILFLKYLHVFEHIVKNYKNIDDERYSRLVREMVLIIKGIQLTENEFIQYLGFHFYENLFYDKYIYNMYKETEKKINKKIYKYIFIQDNLILYKIKKEIKRIIKQIGGIFKWKN